MSILEEIFAHKRLEVAQRKRDRPLDLVMAQAVEAPPPVNFVSALLSGEREIRDGQRWPALIAEVKYASPSKGSFDVPYNPLELARLYRSNGASAISVLTDQHYFRGSLDTLRQVVADMRDHPPRLPVLCKDFFCDPYQVYEARAAGADAVLLIAAYLAPDLLAELHGLACSLEMAPLVEVHSLEEVDAAMTICPRLLGVNNRDLRDFTVSLERTLSLRTSIPRQVCLVAESGIYTEQDVSLLAGVGVDAILVGEALVTARDIPAQVRSLAGSVVVG